MSIDKTPQAIALVTPTSSKSCSNLLIPGCGFSGFVVLQNKDKAISCAKSKPYVEHCYSLPMIAEIESVMKKSGHK